MTDASAVAIREGVPSDFDAVKEMWKNLFTLHKEWGYAFEVSDAMAAEWVKSFEKTLGRFSFLWVAEHEGTVTGFLLMRLLYSSPHAGRVTVAHVSELWISPTMQGANLGSRLVEAAYAKAKALGVHSIETQTMVKNSGGQKFWEKQGMNAEFIQYRRRL